MSKRALISTLHTEIDSATRDNITQQLQLSSTILLEITQPSLLFLVDSTKKTNDRFSNNYLLALYNLYILD